MALIRRDKNTERLNMVYLVSAQWRLLLLAGESITVAPMTAEKTSKTRRNRIKDYFRQ